MNDQQLNALLKAARPPQRPAGYWEQFPDSVLRAVQKEIHLSLADRPSRPGPAWSWGLGLATACVLLAVTFIWRGSRERVPLSSPAEQAELNHYFREIAALFPHQVKAIVFEETGPRLVLAETASVPDSPPVYVRICSAQSCRSFITFSGQRVRTKGHEFEVLLDAEGGVIVVGDNALWTSSGPHSANLPFRIEARRLHSPG